MRTIRVDESVNVGEDEEAEEAKRTKRTGEDRGGHGVCVREREIERERERENGWDNLETKGRSSGASKERVKGDDEG